MSCLGRSFRLSEPICENVFIYYFFLSLFRDDCHIPKLPILNCPRVWLLVHTACHLIPECSAIPKRKTQTHGPSLTNPQVWQLLDCPAPQGTSALPSTYPSGRQRAGAGCLLSGLLPSAHNSRSWARTSGIWWAKPSPVWPWLQPSRVQAST